MNYKITIPLFIILIILASGCNETKDVSTDEIGEVEAEDEEEECVWAYDTANPIKCREYCGEWSFKTASKAYDSSTKCRLDLFPILEEKQKKELEELGYDITY